MSLSDLQSESTQHSGFAIFEVDLVQVPFKHKVFEHKVSVGRVQSKSERHSTALVQFTLIRERRRMATIDAIISLILFPFCLLTNEVKFTLNKGHKLEVRQIFEEQ